VKESCRITEESESRLADALRGSSGMCVCVCVYIYIFTYIYIERERERERDRQQERVMSHRRRK